MEEVVIQIDTINTNRLPEPIGITSKVLWELGDEITALLYID